MSCRSNNKFLTCWRPKPLVFQPGPTIAGTLRIIKVASGGDGTFQFTINPNAGGVTATTITTSNGNGFVDIPNVSQGLYTVTEPPQAGWTGGGQVTVNVISNGLGSATFINRRVIVTTGTLVIQKTVNGQDSTFQFNIFPSAGGITNTQVTTLGGQGSTTISDVTPGIYTITEVPTVGWTGPANVVIDVPPGGTGTASFTNTQSLLGTLIIEKETINAAGAFSYEINPPIPGVTNTVIITSGSQIPQSLIIPNVAPGHYDITENFQAGWSGDETLSTVVPAGGTATVSFTNTAENENGTIVVNKVSNGGTGSFDFEVVDTPFFFTIDTVAAGVTATMILSDIIPGNYTIFETIPDGWSGVNSMNVDVVSGQVSILTFVNNRQGTLVINKTSLGGTGNFIFDIDPSAGGVFTVDIATEEDGIVASEVIINVTPGDYNIIELSQPGWTGTVALDVTVPAGGTAFADFVNNAAPLTNGTLVITKISNGRTGNFSFIINPAIPGFGDSLNITTQNPGLPETVTIFNVPPGDYLITELAQPGWTGTVAVDVIVSAGGTAFADFENNPVPLTDGTLVITKTSNGGTGDFSFTINPAIPGFGDSLNIATQTPGETETVTIFNVLSGDYLITELGQTGWTGATGVTTTVPVGGTGTAAFTNTVFGLGRLVISKTSVGGTGDFIFRGPLGTFEIRTYGTGGGGVGSITSSLVPAGIYVIREDDQNGWVPHEPVEVQIPVGASGIAEFTNIRTGTLTITKVADDAGIFEFNVTRIGGTGLTASVETTGPLVPALTNIYNVVPGVYQISEVPQSGWTGFGPPSVNIPPGGMGSILYNNFRTVPGTIVIDKTSIGGTGTFTFTTSPDVIGPVTITTSGTGGGGTGSTTITNVPTGNYMVIETEEIGWTGTAEVAVTVDENTTATASFVNSTIMVGSLTVVKESVGGTGIFNFTIDNGSGLTGGFSIETIGTSVGGTGSIPLVGIPTGNYIITEDPQIGWTGTTGVNITISATGGGETATFFNTALTPELLTGNSIIKTSNWLLPGMITPTSNDTDRL